MKDAEGLLTLISIIYALAIISLAKSRLPQRGVKQRILGHLDAHFVPGQLPTYLTSLGLTGALSVALGYAISHALSLTVEFVVFNLVIMAVAGINLFLYRNE